jgi:catalase (peroxidase I)
MLASTSNQGRSESQAADVLIPLIRAAATIGFAVAPCSLSDPMGEEFDYAKEFKSLDLNAVIKDLRR